MFDRLSSQQVGQLAEICAAVLAGFAEERELDKASPIDGDHWRRDPSRLIWSPPPTDRPSPSIPARACAGLGQVLAAAHGADDARAKVAAGAERLEVLVTKSSIVEAIGLLYVHAGLLVEPAAALGVASILADRGRFGGKTVATILCRSNVTPTDFDRWIRERAPASPAESFTTV